MAERGHYSLVTSSEACLPFQYGLSTPARHRSRPARHDPVGRYGRRLEPRLQTGHAGCTCCQPSAPAPPLLPYARQFCANGMMTPAWRMRCFGRKAGSRATHLFPGSAFCGSRNHTWLRDGEAVFAKKILAFLDIYDTVDACAPERVPPILTACYCPRSGFVGARPHEGLRRQKKELGTQQVRNPQTSLTRRALRRILKAGVLSMTASLTSSCNFVTSATVVVVGGGGGVVVVVVLLLLLLLLCVGMGHSPSAGPGLTCSRSGRQA